MSEYELLDKVSVFLKTAKKEEVFSDIQKLKKAVVSKEFIKELFDSVPKDLLTVFMQDAEVLYGKMLSRMLEDTFITNMTTLQIFYDSSRELLGCFRAPIGPLAWVFQAHFELDKNDNEHFGNHVLSFSPALQRELVNPTFSGLHRIISEAATSDNIVSISFFSGEEEREMLVEEMRRLCKEKYSDATGKN